MSDYVIETKGLTRYYGQFCALEAVDLKIEKGRVVALLGPNGAGKTTLLHLVMGMLEPTSGTVMVCGQGSREQINLDASLVGYMSDIDHPPGWMTGRQMIELQAGANSGFDKGYAESLITGRELSLTKAYGTMSKGQKKWLRAVMVLASRPELIIMDEPAEGLDPEARYELYDCLKEYIIDSGATAVVATHIIGDIERIADDVAVIDHGLIVTHSPLEDLRDDVYEVYMPCGAEVEFGNGTMKVLGKIATSEGTIFWLQSHQAEIEKMQQQSEQPLNVRHVDLQTYYMAVTKRRNRGDKNEN